MTIQLNESHYIDLTEKELIIYNEMLNREKAFSSKSDISRTYFKNIAEKVNDDFVEGLGLDTEDIYFCLTTHAMKYNHKIILYFIIEFAYKEVGSGQSIIFYFTETEKSDYFINILLPKIYTNLSFA